MTLVNSTVCDQCKCVIATGTQFIQGGTWTMNLSGGPSTFQDLDFCSTAHFVAYVQALPSIPVPATQLGPVPGH